MSKKEIVKAAVQAIEDICKNGGYTRIKTGGEPVLFYFSRIDESYVSSFSFSFSDRKIYSIFGHINIVYKELTDIMRDLMQGTIYEENYSVKPQCAYYKGVGIHSEIGRHVKNDKTLYIASTDEAKSFAQAFYGQIKEEEQNFILPHADIKNTIAGFMKRIYYFWPDDLTSFLEHLVSYGLATNDRDLIAYALKKIDEVLPKVSATSITTKYTIEFLAVLKTRLKQLGIE
jgi:hypothetical protein